ncbi:hypothetical protein AZE42_14039 [Rhizopogon vesiculosus]|uniref:Uncharacterized protein n=1 Tax=Rhizopogon vesiculosus TaxID=180088 RepID=A0A1J8QWA7_9AGAM|nr:hypothetical protein AZE42_14039 [Rhizopogon vesiculosus]
MSILVVIYTINYREYSSHAQ